MARLPRHERAGAWYHVTARGNERKAIYRADADRCHFLELLPKLTERYRVRLYVYVLMDNHYHLLVETLEPNLGRALHWLNVSYTVWFNRRYQRSGHLFQGRYNAVVVEPETWALELSRYVHLNPVRRKGLGLDKATRKAQRRGLSGRPSPEQVQQRRQRLRAYR